MLKVLTANCLLFAYIFVAVCVLSINADTCSAQDSNVVEKFVFRGQSQAVFRKSVVAQLDVVISNLNTAYGLSENQIAKIRLAGEVDIERFLREGERLRGDVDEFGLNLNRENAMQVMETLAPLRQRIDTGFFNESSLFAKTLYSVLTPEQVKMSPHRNLLNRSIALRSLILKLPRVAPIEPAQREQLKEMIKTQEKFLRDAQRRPSP